MDGIGADREVIMGNPRVGARMVRMPVVGEVVEGGVVVMRGIWLAVEVAMSLTGWCAVHPGVKRGRWWWWWWWWLAVRVVRA